MFSAAAHPSSCILVVAIRLVSGCVSVCLSLSLSLSLSRAFPFDFFSFHLIFSLSTSGDLSSSWSSTWTFFLRSSLLTPRICFLAASVDSSAASSSTSWWGGVPLTRGSTLSLSLFLFLSCMYFSVFFQKAGVCVPNSTGLLGTEKWCPKRSFFVSHLVFSLQAIECSKNRQLCPSPLLHHHHHGHLGSFVPFSPCFVFFSFLRLETRFHAHTQVFFNRF